MRFWDDRAGTGPLDLRLRLLDIGLCGWSGGIENRLAFRGLDERGDLGEIGHRFGAAGVRYNIDHHRFTLGRELLHRGEIGLAVACLASACGLLLHAGQQVRAPAGDLGECHGEVFAGWVRVLDGDDSLGPHGGIGGEHVTGDHGAGLRAAESVQHGWIGGVLGGFDGGE